MAAAHLVLRGRCWLRPGAALPLVQRPLAVFATAAPWSSSSGSSDGSSGCGGGGGSSSSSSSSSRWPVPVAAEPHGPRLASEALRSYAARRGSLAPREAADLLQTVGDLKPSVYDERLQALVQEVLARKEDLPLTTLVGVSRALQVLGLHKELGELAGLALESASFLSPDVVLAFARTLAVTSRLAAPGASAQAHAAVFRILGEHVQEAMFDAAPGELAEALLAIAVFHCSRGGGAPDPVLSRPWHPQVFASAAGLLQDRAEVLPPQALLKCLRAYELFLVAGPPAAEAGEAALDLRQAAQLPAALAEALAPRLAELPARGAVRGLTALAALRRRGRPLEAGGRALCAAAGEELLRQQGELGVRDISFALGALASLSDARWAPLAVPVSAGRLRALYDEVQHHIHDLTLEDALRMSKASERLASVERPGVLLDLLAAEVLRDLRNLEPQSLCDAVVTFGRMRFESPGFMENLAQAFVVQLPKSSPQQVSTTLHAFARWGLHEGQLYAAVAPEIVRSLLGYRPRDLALCLWSFAKAAYVDAGLFEKAQDDLKLHATKLSPADVSMVLWSYGKAEWRLDDGLLSGLAHNVATGCRRFPPVALIVTCLGFARLGFAQQTVLVELYRSLYGQLPGLSDSQLAYSFFLFSTSGIRDEALQRRFLYESSQRLPRLRGQNLSNVVLACSRSAGSEALKAYGLLPGLRERIFGQLRALGDASCQPAPLLGIYLGAPELLALSREECRELMGAMAGHVPRMDPSELARCLLATAKVELVHKPFLLPLFLRLHKAREELQAPEVVSCIWAVYLLDFCKPKLRRSLGFMLVEHTRRRRVPARTLLQILPALGKFGFWERLPNSLRRSVWRLATEDLRQYVSQPPPKPEAPVADGDVPDKPWRLPPLTPGLFRRRGRQGELLSAAHRLEDLRRDPRKEEREERREQRELSEELGRPRATGATAVADFISMVQRL